MKGRILYEDNHIVVVDKPRGLLTQASGTDRDNLEDLLKEEIRIRDNKPGNVFLHAVFRLDKPVSGIVLFAKTSKALSRLQQTQREKKAEKKYLALVEGRLAKDKGRLEHKLVHDSYRAKVSPEGKLAKLRYQVVEADERQSLLQITLETGRYHQIRVQLATIGHPIVGDHKYGSSVDFEDGMIALHHETLKIAHPITGEILLIHNKKNLCSLRV